jgi:pimeloyl-ACP methyl ester carboxylesterase
VGFSYGTALGQYYANMFPDRTRAVVVVSSNKLLPNSRLLSSDSWGHTAYGTSAYVTDAVDGYLVQGTLPPGKVCVGDVPPPGGHASAVVHPSRHPVT